MKNLFDGIYYGKTVLITGNTGFKGSWLAFWLQNLGANVIGYSKNDTSSPSHHQLLQPKYKTYYQNIKDRDSLIKVFYKHKPEIIFHLAAQSLVRESYQNPYETYETNVMGTMNVLEASRQCKSVRAIVNVTTDKVYENLEKNILYTENDRIGGRDLYSSSKACSEILSASYRKTFFSDNRILLATARAGNVVGGGDWSTDRLIPDLIRSVSEKKTAYIRNPNSIRPWQHVLEPLSGYLLLGEMLLQGKTKFSRAWNFGPSEESCIEVSKVINRMKSKWGKINYRTDKPQQKVPYEAGILRINSTKALKDLGWKPIWNIDKTIERTSDWYKTFFEEKTISTNENLHVYIADANKLKTVWCR